MNIKPMNISDEEKTRIFEESLKNQTPYVEKEPVKIQPVIDTENMATVSDEFICKKCGLFRCCELCNVQIYVSSSRRILQENKQRRKCRYSRNTNKP